MYYFNFMQRSYFLSPYKNNIENLFFSLVIPIFIQKLLNIYEIGLLNLSLTKKKLSAHTHSHANSVAQGCRRQISSLTIWDF